MLTRSSKEEEEEKERDEEEEEEKKGTKRKKKKKRIDKKDLIRFLPSAGNLFDFLLHVCRINVGIIERVLFQRLGKRRHGDLWRKSDEREKRREGRRRFKSISTHRTQRESNERENGEGSWGQSTEEPL